MKLGNVALWVATLAFVGWVISFDLIPNLVTVVFLFTLFGSIWLSVLGVNWVCDWVDAYERAHSPKIEDSEEGCD